MFYTYSIKNNENGKFYIGSRTAKCMLNRKPEDDLGIKYFSSSKDKELRKAIKDGKVEYHVLQEYNDIKVCYRAEQQLIALYWKFFGKDMSYNHSYINCEGENVFSTAGIEVNKGKIRSNETKKKLSEAHKGKQFSEEHKQKISEARRGKQLSEEHKKKLSEARKGKHHSDETKKKIGDAHKGKPTFYGKHHSDETKKKISESNKGKPSTFKGKQRSEEHKQKISEALKGKPQQKFYWQTIDDEIKIMDKANANRYHKDWTLIGPVENKENN